MAQDAKTRFGTTRMGRAPPIAPPGASCGPWRPPGQRSGTSPKPRFQNPSIAGWDCVPAFWDRSRPGAGRRALVGYRPRAGALTTFPRQIPGHRHACMGAPPRCQSNPLPVQPAARPTCRQPHLQPAPPSCWPARRWAARPLRIRPQPASLAPSPTVPRQNPGHRHACMGAPPCLARPLRLPAAPAAPRRGPQIPGRGQSAFRRSASTSTRCRARRPVPARI